MPMESPAMPLLQLAKFRLLFGREERRDTAMRLLKDAADLLHGLLAFRLQLGSGAINYGRDLLHLLGRQIQFYPQMSLHVLRYRSMMWMTKHPWRAAKRSEEPAGNSGEEDENEGEDQFPSQRAIHSPRLLSIALSAIVYSLCKSLVELES